MNMPPHHRLTTVRRCIGLAIDIGGLATLSSHLWSRG